MASNQTLSHGNRTSMGAFLHVSPAVSYFACSLNTFISILAILGNSLVLLAFFKTHKIRKCRTNYLIASLAVADLIVACVAIPIWSYMILTNFSSFPTREPIYHVYQVFDMFSAAASIEHLLFISLERYFAVVWPVIHHLATSTIYGFVIAFVWIVSITFSCAFFKILRLIENYSIVNSVLLFGIPLAIIMFSYLSILKITIQRRSLCTRRKTVERELKIMEGELDRKLTKPETKFAQLAMVAFTILILVVLFVITWCPFFVMSVVVNQCRTCVTLNTVIFLKCLHFTNSLCNPIVYAARVPDFRTAFSKVLPKNLLRLLTCREKLRDRDSPPSSHGRTSSAASGHTFLAEDADSRRRPTISDVTPLDVSTSTPPRESILSVSMTTSPDRFVSLLGSSPSPAYTGFQLTSV